MKKEPVMQLSKFLPQAASRALARLGLYVPELIFISSLREAPSPLFEDAISATIVN